ncbi:aminotransferase class V-fold PLP-dependent enzyme [Fibrella sp. HMF5335]|uniref:Aminotransferase class V-fold PLP-dependent enzyme n=1 Tax=Fibrella rubiginis TaxID=2817060 RepID=A0A939GFR3_9BACT|nr:pyridoxal-dependent decarboxylase [Fibrella rubiginis]MBO0935687.1 aminotransferase class V-fold PLP-dependent enzyme [Fibrella rubiginis]
MNTLKKTLSLDPDNWNDLRALGHRMVDDMFDYLQQIGEQPAWKAPTDDVKAHLAQPLPLEGQPAEAVYAEFLRYILPYNNGNIHPRFFSWVQTTGTPLGMLASGMTPNVTIGDHAAMYVDKQVIDWCKALMNFPENASGMLVSGATMANLTSLLVARHTADRDRIRRYGVRGTDRPLVLYASAETHSCVQKAVEVMGLGSEALRKVPVNASYQLDDTALQSMIEADLAAGLHPFCVVGNAGTVNTGAIDPLDAIADLCQQYNLWFHVDGAFGALAKLVPAYAHSLAAIERADSVAFDLHKWLSMPYEVGCALIRNADLHRDAFAMTPTYLARHERGLAGGPDSLSNYGIELSRGFKALKVWMSFKTFGVDRLGAVIAQNIEQAQYLAQRINDEPQLELLAPAPMNIVCYRFNPRDGRDTDALNALNKEILMRLHEQGIATPSYTLLGGRYAIRVAHVNHRTQLADLDILVEGSIRIGGELIR